MDKYNHRTVKGREEAKQRSISVAGGLLDQLKNNVLARFVGGEKFTIIYNDGKYTIEFIDSLEHIR